MVVKSSESSESEESWSETPGRSRKSSAVLPNWTNPALYKTRICDHFRQKGECKFGRKCWFAHGGRELRQVPRLDKYPEAEVDALAQVIETLPPSRSRDVALFKGHQLTQEMLAKHEQQQRNATNNNNNNRRNHHNKHNHPAHPHHDLHPQHLAQIEPLLQQLKKIQMEQRQKKERFHSNTSIETSILLSSQPEHDPISRLDSTDLPDLIHADANHNTYHPQKAFREQTQLDEIEEHVFHVTAPPRSTLVDQATNTDPHPFFDSLTLKEAANRINPDDYNCFLEVGGVAVRYDPCSYAFAYPV